METLQRTANRGSISTGYDIDNSLKFEADNTELIYRTNNSGTNSKTFTVSAWFKRTELGVDQQVWHGGTFGEATRIGISSYQVADESLWVDVAGGSNNSGTQYRSFSTLKIRDTSAWYHVCVAVDTTQATEANRMKVWLNGVEVTDWAQHQIPAQNFQCALESGTQMAWGGYRPSNVVLFSGYLAECHYLDGVAKVQTDFGEYDEDSGIWKPKKYTGTYGGNGCYLDFESSGSLGADSSGNGNNFTLNNITSADQAQDTPTNNFCTLNPLSAGGNRGNVITEGATKVVIENSGQQVAVGTIAVTKGKWYWEAKHTSGTYQLAGIISADSRVSGNGGVADSSVAGSDAIAFYRVNGQVFYNGTGTAFDTNGYANGDIIGVALDMDNGTCALYEDGVLMGNTGSNDIVATSGHASLTGAWQPMYTDGTNGTFNITYEVNFGGYHTYSISSGNTDENGYGNFEYAPPSGYYALCTKNLAEFG